MSRPSQICEHPFLRGAASVLPPDGTKCPDCRKPITVAVWVRALYEQEPLLLEFLRVLGEIWATRLLALEGEIDAHDAHVRQWRLAGRVGLLELGV